MSALPLRIEPLRVRPRDVFVFAIACATLWFFAARYWDVVMDDPFITFRYADNLVSGKGLCYRAGEPVEGYSNFTWVLLSAAAIKANVDPLGLARLAGLASVIAMFGLLCFAGDREGETSSVLRWSALLLAGCYPLHAWAAGGLETTFYAMLVLATAWLGGEIARGPRPLLGVAMGLCIAVAAMTRPEGAMLAALPVAAGLVESRRYARGKYILALIVFAAVFIPYTLWRYSTFHALLPNSVTAKTGGALAETLRRGVVYLFGGRAGLEGYFGAPPIALALFAAIGFRRGLRAAPRGDAGEEEAPGYAQPRALAAQCGAFVLLQGVFCLLVGGDWMPAFRFVVPMLAPLCILAAFGMTRVPPFVGFVLAMFLLLSAPMQARHERIGHSPILEWSRRHPEGGWHMLARIGEEIGALAPPGGTILLTEAGIIPYVARLDAWDTLGLVDRDIAARAGGLHEKYDAATALAHRPAYVLLGVSEDASRKRVGLWAPDQQILNDPGFRTEYVEVRRWPRPIPDDGLGAIPAWMILYERRQPVR